MPPAFKPPAAIVAWGRPLGYETSLHAIVDLGSTGSMVTSCSGRWGAVEPVEIYYGNDSEGRFLRGEFCDACTVAWLTAPAARACSTCGGEGYILTGRRMRFLGAQLVDVAVPCSCRAGSEG